MLDNLNCLINCHFVIFVNYMQLLPIHFKKVDLNTYSRFTHYMICLEKYSIRLFINIPTTYYTKKF